MSDPVNTGPRWPTIPEPNADPYNLLQSVSRLKEAMELLTGQRGFDDSYSVDNRFDTMSKTLDNMSATFSQRIQLAVNQYGALVERTTVLEAQMTVVQDEQSDLAAGQITLDARITSVDTASVSRDGALATSVNIVQARVDDVSAGGFFKTSAAVSGGALASMEAYVYTDTSHTGLHTAGWRVQIVAGVSYFDMYASRWRLIDNTGIPKAVMVYDGSRFVFTADVAINGGLVVVGTIDNPQLAALAVTYPKIYPASATQGAAAIGTSAAATVSIYLRAGSSIVVIATSDAYVSPSGLESDAYTNFVLTVNGGGVQTYFLLRSGNIFNVNTGDGTVTYASWNVLPYTMSYVYTAGYTGTHTITLSTQWASAEKPIAKRVSVIELAR